MDVLNKIKHYTFTSLVLSMNKYADVGFTSFDMADIYGPAEDIFGMLIKSVRATFIRVFTL